MQLITWEPLNFHPSVRRSVKNQIIIGVAPGPKAPTDKMNKARP
jgi:hypothetical protein